MSWKGWLFAVSLMVLLAYHFAVNGGFMRGDRMDLSAAPQC
jgi:hypothetical protein